MHPDPSSDPEPPAPVVHVSQTPMYVAQPDGKVRGYYPGEDWYITGADQDDAADKLAAEVHRRMQDPNYIAQHFALAQQHLRGDTVTPGFEVDTISAEHYEQRTNELGDQLHHP
jgi:hypothetical protein